MLAKLQEEKDQFDDVQAQKKEEETSHNEIPGIQTAKSSTQSGQNTTHSWI
jgi:hypothetical protein